MKKVGILQFQIQDLISQILKPFFVRPTLLPNLSLKFLFFSEAFITFLCNVFKTTTTKQFVIKNFAHLVPKRA